MLVLQCLLLGTERTPMTLLWMRLGRMLPQRMLNSLLMTALMLRMRPGGMLAKRVRKSSPARAPVTYLCSLGTLSGRPRTEQSLGRMRSQQPPRLEKGSRTL